MRAPLLFCTLLLASGIAHAQADAFFGSGKPPVFVEQDLDRRFAKSRVARGLSQGTEDANCVHLLGGLFTVLAETAPTLHQRDENFYLDPTLIHALNTQLSNPQFPGSAYLASMVRRVWIDGKLPPQWLEVARELNQTVRIIDLAKLQLLADGVKPIDSFYFSFPALQERYEIEVKRANSVAKGTAVLAFRDAYVDREVAWGGLTLVDIAPAKKKGRKGKATSEEENVLIARLHYVPPDPVDQSLMPAILGGRRKPKPVVFEARLSPQQYVDLDRVPKGKRLLVRGRFWEMNDALTKIELRNAVLFEDRDWSKGVLLADPAAVARCHMAVNELAGIAPIQPGGFGDRR
ncbi:MAG: hypothetical protein WBV82_09125 [Myxococcaceae bacterium]